MKSNWNRLICEKDIKQEWIAMVVGVDASRVSRWKDPDAESEKEGLQETIAKLRRIADAMDDAISGNTEVAS